MASSTAVAANGHGVATKALRRHLWRYRLTAVAWVVLGLLLLSANLGVLEPPVTRAVHVAWPVALVAAGGLLLWGRWRGAEPPLPTFAVERGQVECAELVLNTGGADAQVRAFGGASQLLVGEFPGPDGPLVRQHDSAARVTLEPRLALPHWPGCWSLALAKGLPWELDARSTTGDLTLDLRDLTVLRLNMHSLVGHVDLTLPAAGQAVGALRLAAGNLTVRVPDGMDAKLRVRAGWLASVRCDARRFAQVAPGEWVTPLYATASQRCTLDIHLTAGDLHVQ